MKENTKFIKVVYLLGVIVDGIWAVILAFPSLYKVITNNPSLELSLQFKVILIITSSLMFGWTLLLFWAYKEPIERRFILIITAFPVVFGIFIGTLISYLNGSSIAIIFVVKTLLILILLIIAYIKSEIIFRNRQ